MTDRVQWGKGRRDDFLSYACYEIERVRSERDALERIWRNHLSLYRAPIDKSVRRFPFEGASNVTYPLARMNVDPILARYLRTLHAPANLWTLEALNERWVPVAKPMSDFLQWLDMYVLKMWGTNYRVLDETIKLGTGVYKVGWRFERHQVQGYDADLKRTPIVRTINQPTVDHVPLAHFLVPPESLDVDPDAQGGAPWVAERLRFRPNALAGLAKAQEPFLPNFNPEGTTKVLKFEESAPTEHQQRVREMDHLPGSHGQMLQRPVELYEFHARFDVDGSGMESDVVAVVHVPSRTLLRATHNPWSHTKRPYHVIRYRRGDGFYGIGVCEQAEVWQRTISDVLNFNMDKILLSNAPMLGIREGANVLPNEPIFPGKIWPLTNPKDDLVPFFLNAPGSFDLNSLMAFLQEAGKQATGVTDLQFGSVGAVPSRTPAATVAALLQEGNTRFDMSIQDARLSGLNGVGLQILQLLQQQVANPVNNPDGSRYLSLAAMVLGEPEGTYVSQSLALPFEPVETGVGVAITATSGTANKELLKQNNLALLQLYAQLGPQFLQLAQMATQFAGTPIGQVATDLFKGGAEFLYRTLEQFDVRNLDEVVPNVQALLAAQSAIAGGGPVQPLGGGFGGAGGAGGAAGMGGMAPPA